MGQSVGADSTSLDATFARVSEAALQLYELAASHKLALRLIGSLAVRLRCPHSGDLFEVMGRRPYRDIDFMGLDRQKRELEALFEAGGWLADPALKYSQEFDIKRLIFSRPNGELKVDVFLDELVMAHTIDFRDRLELDSPTVTLADLLLSKLQIHDITDNDLIDVLALLSEHDVGTAADQSIDLGRVVKLMRGDWGFYHTAMLNLEKARRALSAATLRGDIASAISARLTRLGAAIEAEPKSLRWKLRADVGTRVRWYQDVPEVERD